MSRNTVTQRTWCKYLAALMMVSRIFMQIIHLMKIIQFMPTNSSSHCRVGRILNWSSALILIAEVLHDKRLEIFFPKSLLFFEETSLIRALEYHISDKQMIYHSKNILYHWEKKMFKCHLINIFSIKTVR